MENFLIKIENELKITSIKNVFIFSHTKHDADAKGSALALVSYFKNKGYNSKYIITHEDYLLLNIFEKVKITKNISDIFIAICVDTSTSSIVENDLYLNSRKTFKIDHHNGENFCNHNLVNLSASSTCEIISSLIDEKDITPKIADYLYTGIFTDTGGFLYNTCENTFLQIAKLTKKGANLNFINRSLTVVSSKRKRIEGIVYTNHKFFSKDLVGSIISYFPKELKALSIARGVNGLTNMNAKIFFCIIKDSCSNKAFVEIRSSSTAKIDVSNIAKKYGGGGSFHASGFTLNDFNSHTNVINELHSLIK